MLMLMQMQEDKSVEDGDSTSGGAPDAPHPNSHSNQYAHFIVAGHFSNVHKHTLSWDGASAGPSYTKADVESLSSVASTPDFTGIDVLLTCDWPTYALFFYFVSSNERAGMLRTLLLCPALSLFPRPATTRQPPLPPYAAFLSLYIQNYSIFNAAAAQAALPLFRERDFRRLFRARAVPQHPPHLVARSGLPCARDSLLWHGARRQHRQGQVAGTHNNAILSYFNTVLCHFCAIFVPFLVCFQCRSAFKDCQSDTSRRSRRRDRLPLCIESARRRRLCERKAAF